jgi:hypothetical protein
MTRVCGQMTRGGQMARSKEEHTPRIKRDHYSALFCHNMYLIFESIIWQNQLLVFVKQNVRIVFINPYLFGALLSIDSISPQIFAQFPRMLVALEEAKAALGVLSYGLSVTTLEDVFLRVAANEEKHHHHHHHSSSSSDDADSAPAAMAISASGALRFSQARLAVMKQ